MKKGMFVFLSASLVLLLSGCANIVEDKENSTMYIEEVQLLEQISEDESQEMNPNQKVYDFFLDDSVQSAHIDVYELQDGTWEKVSGSEQALQDTEGRVIVDMGSFTEELTIGIQELNANTFMTCGMALKSEDTSAMSCVTSTLSEKTDITYGQEIPLVVQIITSKDEITSYDVEYFEHPEEYEKFNYECVRAITVTFKQS